MVIRSLLRLRLPKQYLLYIPVKLGATEALRCSVISLQMAKNFTVHLKLNLHRQLFNRLGESHTSADVIRWVKIRSCFKGEGCSRCLAHHSPNYADTVNGGLSPRGKHLLRNIKLKMCLKEENLQQRRVWWHWKEAGKMKDSNVLCGEATLTEESCGKQKFLSSQGKEQNRVIQSRISKNRVWHFLMFME